MVMAWMLSSWTIVVIGDKNRIKHDIELFIVQDQSDVIGQIDWFTDRIEQIAEFLDKRYSLPVQASISNVHEGIGELETAYHESLLAMEYCFLNDDIAISRFDAQEFKSDRVFLDSIYLNK